MIKTIRALLMALVCLSAFGQSDDTDDLNLNAMIGSVGPQNIFSQDDHYIWCGSAIRGKDGQYHLFYARWPHGKRERKTDSMNYIFDEFRGWLRYSEIAYAKSASLGGPYVHQQVILKGDGDTARWDRFTMHNPQIRQFGNKYYLYYISNNFDPNFTLPKATPDWLHWMKYNATQGVGVLVANSIEDLVNGKFTRAAKPLIRPDNVHTFEVATNPSVTEGPDGRYYMMFKSRMPNVGHMTMWMAVADSPAGPFTLANEVFTQREYACEDPCLWYDKQRKRFYAVMKNYVRDGKLAAQHGALVLITSTDGLHWKAARHTLVSNREITDEKGEKILLENLERPFIFLGEDGQPLVLFAAARKQLTQPLAQGEINNTFNVQILLKTR